MKSENARGRINIDSSNSSFHFASIMTDASTRNKQTRAKMRRERIKRDEHKFNISFHATYSRDAGHLYILFFFLLYPN